MSEAWRCIVTVILEVIWNTYVIAFHTSICIRDGMIHFKIYHRLHDS